MKTCSKCGECKPLDEFYGCKSAPGGYKSPCKECQRAQARERYKDDPEKKKASLRQSRIKHPEAYRKRQAACKLRHREKAIDTARWYKRKRAYGITREQFEAMLETQSHSCAVCGTAVGVSANVDHCHASGVVRGLLCNSCNTAIGHLRDSPEIMRRAAAYVEVHRG